MKRLKSGSNRHSARQTWEMIAEDGANRKVLSIGWLVFEVEWRTLRAEGEVYHGILPIGYERYPGARSRGSILKPTWEVSAVTRNK
jgi:hypothetical protein